MDSASKEIHPKKARTELSCGMRLSESQGELLSALLAPLFARTWRELVLLFAAGRVPRSLDDPH